MRRLTKIIIPLLFISLCFAGNIIAKKEIIVKVDPRIELLAAIQMISDYNEQFNLITRFEFPYKSEMISYFFPFKSHKAVLIFEQMSHDGFSYDAPPGVMIHLSNPPELKIETPFTDYLNRRAGGKELLMEFIEAIRDFAKESNFMQFWEKHTQFYQATVNKVEETMAGQDYVATLENYFGVQQSSYNIVLSPLFHSGGFGPRVERKTGQYDIYHIGGPHGVFEEIPLFGNAQYMQHLAWHEFGHSFVNPTTEKFHEQINQYIKLFDPISQQMKDMAYSSWETCVNEHLVRAVTTRLTYIERDKQAGDKALQGELNRSFFYTTALCEKLEYYEIHRDKYPSFIDFYPEIIAVFQELSEKDLSEDFYMIPFTGTINGVTLDKSSVVIIIPTNEKRTEIQNQMHEFVKIFQGRFYKDSPVITDKDAIGKDLSKNSLMLFGTLKGNLWLNKYKDIFPFILKPNQIIADSTYNGTNLRFITAWPHPENSKRGIAIYSAQRAKDIININRVIHGPTDFVIAKERTVLKSADYNKKNNKWSFLKK
jgi:hypothetical protein